MEGSEDEVVVERLSSGAARFLAWANTRPGFVVRRAPTLTWATRGVFAGAGSLALAVVLAAGLALAGRGGASPSSARPSQVAAATLTPTPTGTPYGLFSAGPFDTSSPGSLAPGDSEPSPGPTTNEPTEPPAPRPTTPHGTRQPKILAHASCSAVGGYTTNGNTIYASCVNDHYPSGGGLTEIRAFNATTGTAVATYSVPDQGVKEISAIEVDGGIWATMDPAGACMAPCPLDWNSRVVKINPSTKQVTFTLPGWSLAGDGFGSIWAAKMNATSIEALTRIDPATNKTSQIPFAFSSVEIACGSLWGMTRTNNPETTTLTRVDPNTGAKLQSFTEPGRVDGLTETPEGCWATNGGTQFVKVGPSGIEARSPSLRGAPVILNGTFWMHWSDGPDGWDYLQRLDPATWQPTGAIYSLMFYGGGGDPYPIDYLGRAFTAGNSVWLVTESAQTWDDYWRLDIPLGPLPAAPSPTSSPTLTPTPSTPPSPAAS